MRALADHSTTEPTGCRSGYVATGSACVAPTSASSTTRASSSASSTVKPTTTTRASTSATTSRVSTSTSAAPAASSTGWPTSGGLIAGGYYPDWVEDVMPPEALNYKMFDLINYGASHGRVLCRLPSGHD